MSESTTERGHLFVIDGDLTKIACDAWLLPTDPSFDVMRPWIEVFQPGELSEHVTGNEKWWRYENGEWPENRLGEVMHFRKVDNSEVFLANIGHNEADVSVYTGAALEFIRQASKKCPNTGRLPRFAINQIGSGHGGAQDFRGEVISGLIEAIEKELSTLRTKADVILVCWGEKAESAAQYLRHKALTRESTAKEESSFGELNSDLRDKAHELADHFRSSNACVFMGAGVSSGAGLPGWHSLLDSISECITDINAKEDYVTIADPRDKAAFLEQVLPDKGFEIGLIESLESSKYSLQHGLIASLPCHEFITTNVDTLFEDACATNGRSITVLPTREPHWRIDRWLLKLHGSTADPGTMVFTRDHYFNSFRSNRALVGVVQAMLLTKHMLFVGYGLRDEDFHELLYEVKSSLPLPQNGSNMRKLGTVLTLFRDPVQEVMLGDYVDIISMSERPAADPSSHDWKKAESAAIHKLEVFLDLMGMLSSDRSRFLLDSKYASQIAGPDTRSKTPEQILNKLLSDILNKSRKLQNASGWDVIWDALTRLGADPKILGDHPYRRSERSLPGD